MSTGKLIDPNWEVEELENYNEMLDSLFGEVLIGNQNYPTSRAMKSVDSRAYWTGFDYYRSRKENMDVLP